MYTFLAWWSVAIFLNMPRAKSTTSAVCLLENVRLLSLCSSSLFSHLLVVSAQDFLCSYGHEYPIVSKFCEFLYRRWKLVIEIFWKHFFCLLKCFALTMSFGHLNFPEISTISIFNFLKYLCSQNSSIVLNAGQKIKWWNDADRKTQIRSFGLFHRLRRT